MSQTAGKISFSTESVRFQRWLFRHRHDIVAIVVLFSLALGARLLYQGASVVDHPQRADAGKYVRAAANLRLFRVYSLDGLRPDGKAPESRTDLSPGYPIFLSLFVSPQNVVRADDREGNHFTFLSDEVVGQVLLIQAAMGAMTVIFAFVLARFCLTLPWSLLAGAFVAFNPHLIAMDGFLLTESLHIFVVAFGLVMLATAWRTNLYPLTLLGSLLISASAQVRAVTYALPFLLIVVFFCAHNSSPSLQEERF